MLYLMTLCVFSQTCDSHIIAKDFRSWPTFFYTS